MRTSLVPVEYRPPAGLVCRYSAPGDPPVVAPSLLVVAFEGDYPDGSLGQAHGRHVAVMTMHGLHAFDPDVLILDLSGLSYRWGDTLLRVFQEIDAYKNEPGEPPFPVHVVTSDRSRDGFLSLVTPAGSPPPDWHHDDLALAVPAALEAGRRWLDA